MESETRVCIKPQTCSQASFGLLLNSRILSYKVEISVTCVLAMCFPVLIIVFTQMGEGGGGMTPP